MLLIFAIAALLAGPLLLDLGRVGPGFRAFLDSFVFIAVASLLIFGILPESAGTLGSLAWGLALAGALLPLGAEGLLHQATHRMHRAILVLGVLGLLLHGVIDGLILLGAEGHGHSAGEAGGHGDHADELGIAVILHNLPKGMALWLLVSTSFGRPMAAAVLALLPLATAAGYAGGEAVLELLGSGPVAGFQAFAVGTILHVLLHGAGHHAPHRGPLDTAAGPAWAGRLGLVAGLVFMAAYGGLD